MACPHCNTQTASHCRRHARSGYTVKDVAVAVECLYRLRAVPCCEQREYLCDELERILGEIFADAGTLTHEAWLEKAAQS